MGRASGVSRRRKKRVTIRKNLKRVHKKMLTLPKIQCEPIKQAWNDKKSYYANMKEMGLASNVNIAVLPKEKKKRPVKMDVVETLVAEATAPQPQTRRLPTEPMKFCVYMLEKFGEDYQAMAKDPKNYYQETAAQIRKKIQAFRRIPCQWNGYLRAKGLLKDEINDEEYHIDINDCTNNDSMEV